MAKKADDTLSSEIQTKNTEDDYLSKDTQSKKGGTDNNFLEKIVKYIKTDDLIRKKISEHKNEISELKEKKVVLEAQILKYLETIEQKQVNIDGKGKLLRTESIRKGGFNAQLVQQSIFEALQKDRLISDDTKCKEYTESLMKKIEAKRPISTKFYLKRTFENKGKQQEKSTNKETKSTKKSIKFDEIIT
jgi:hypothetical protein